MTESKRSDEETFFDTTLEINSGREIPDSEVSCTPLWLYKIGDTMADLASTDELPDGYATSVGYGERFRNSEYLPLLFCYPIAAFLIILGCLISLGGIAFAIYRWRTSTKLDSYVSCKLSNKKLKCVYVNYIFVVIFCIILTFAIAIMLIANNNISASKEERSSHLQLAQRSIEELKNSTNFEDSLNIFNQLSEKLLRAIEIKAQPYQRENSQKIDAQESMKYIDDIKELLDTFTHANGYMLHFLDSWRYYDANATKFAKAVDTMNSRRALRALRQAREEFANVVYKVIQENRAFYHYFKRLDNLAINKTYAYTMTIHMRNVEDKLERLGNKLQARTTRMKETMDNLQRASEGAGYIEFPTTLLGFGYFICALMLLIVFLSLSFMPVWIFAKNFYRITLPLITVALIFVCYLIFMLPIMYYFLYGMVAKDGVCEGKRAIPSFRFNLIDDLLNISNIYDAKSRALYDEDTAEIAKVLIEIENMSKLEEKRDVANGFATFHVNKTIIQDIYVEMLKVSVYAPKNIEAFGQIWLANRLSTNTILQELNCTHAIGNTMATALHGQVASVMDRLYRTTWRIEAILKDMPEELKANRKDDLAKPSDVTNKNADLQTIFNAERIKLRMGLFDATIGQFRDFEPVAQLFKGFTKPSCKCLVRSMNLFWFGAVVAVLILLLLLALHLWLEAMLRRSCVSNEASSRRRSNSRTRERSRSTSRPDTVLSRSIHTSYSTRPNTPYSSRPDTPYSTRANTPHTSRVTHHTSGATPHTSRARAGSSVHDSPYSSHGATPRRSRLASRHTSPSRASPHSGKHALVHTTTIRSPTPTRGTSLAQKLPLMYDPFINDYNPANVEPDPLADRFTERLSRRDIPPRYQQRKHYYPSLGNRGMTEYFQYETYPELPSVAQQPTIDTPEQQPAKSYTEPKRPWRNDTFHYPGFVSSDLSTKRANDIPRSISEVIEHRGRIQKIASLETSALKDEQPSTTGMKAESPPISPGKVGIVLCPCGCGKPSKIYGTRDDIERIRQAGRICIAKRGDHLRNKKLKPLASIVQLTGDKPAEDNT